MEQIIYKKKLVGLLIRSFPKGSLPQTDGKEPLQLVTLKHPKGKYLLAHCHQPKKRKIEKLQECLIIKKGRVKLDIYSPDKKLIKSIILKTGDCFLLANGGYGIHILEDAEMYELKNGPFIEDKILI